MLCIKKKGKTGGERRKKEDYNKKSYKNGKGEM